MPKDLSTWAKVEDNTPGSQVFRSQQKVFGLEKPVVKTLNDIGAGCCCVHRYLWVSTLQPETIRQVSRSWTGMAPTCMFHKYARVVPTCSSITPHDGSNRLCWVKCPKSSSYDLFVFPRTTNTKKSNRRTFTSGDAKQPFPMGSPTLGEAAGWIQCFWFSIGSIHIVAPFESGIWQVGWSIPKSEINLFLETTPRNHEVALRCWDNPRSSRVSNSRHHTLSLD